MGTEGLLQMEENGKHLFTSVFSAPVPRSWAMKDVTSTDMINTGNGGI